MARPAEGEVAFIVDQMGPIHKIETTCHTKEICSQVDQRGVEAGRIEMSAEQGQVAGFRLRETWTGASVRCVC